MRGWAASQDALRIQGIDDYSAGYIYAWLASSYGQALVLRHQYGSVITHLDREMLAAVPVPLLTKIQRNAIAELVLKANDLRNEAWYWNRAHWANCGKKLLYLDSHLPRVLEYEI